MGLPIATGHMPDISATGVMGYNLPETYSERLIRVLGADLQGYYPLNETSGTTAYDLSTHANNGVYGGSPTLGTTGKLAGEKAVFFGPNSFCNIYSSDFNTRFKTFADEMTIGFWFKAPNAAWHTSNSVNQYLYNFQADGSNERALYNGTTSYHYFIANNNSQGTDRKTTLWGNTDHEGLYCGGSYLDWQHLIFTTSLSKNQSWVFLNGNCLHNAPITGMLAWAGNLASQMAVIGNNHTTAHLYAAGCTMQDFFIASRALSFSDAALLSNPYNASVRKILMIGDSTTANMLSWPLYFVNLMMSTRHVRWAKIPKAHATAGWTTRNAKDNIDAMLAAYTEKPDLIHINLGKNDYDQGPGDPGTVWKTDTEYMINACEAAYAPTVVPVYVTKTWEAEDGHNGRVGACETAMNGYLDQIMADAAYKNFVRMGVNEAVVIEGGDDGATNTYDGIHANDAGGRAFALALQGVLEGTLSFE